MDVRRSEFLSNTKIRYVFTQDKFFGVKLVEEVRRCTSDSEEQSPFLSSKVVLEIEGFLGVLSGVSAGSFSASADPSGGESFEKESLELMDL